MIIIGIDPGAQGAAVAFQSRTEKIIGTCRFDKLSISDIAEWFNDHTDCDLAAAYIERVSASPQMGVTGAFTFGHGAGMLAGILAAHEIRTIEVTPQRWQGAIGAPKRKTKLGKSNADHKRALKAMAQRLFPPSRWLDPERITNDLADALLIAEYGFRFEAELIKIK